MSGLSRPVEAPIAELEIPLGPEVELSFAAMGTRIRLLVGEPVRAGLPGAGEAAVALRGWIEDFDRRLSRFRSDSELSRMNADPSGEPPASPLLLDLVEAGLDAAEASGGLVDPTLLAEIGAAGYSATRSRRADGGPLSAALGVAPPRRAARPDPRRRWRGFRLDRDRGRIVREPGLGFDSGGIGKGLAADLGAARLAGYQRFLIDCGGDIRVGGAGALLLPYEVAVADPLDGSHRRRLRLGSGAVATSGIDGRIWRDGERFAHHILDPSTGRPAWTGLISATAIAPTATTAETLAKTALLAGPAGARSVLVAHGGCFVLDDGTAELVRRAETAPRQVRDSR